MRQRNIIMNDVVGYDLGDFAREYTPIILVGFIILISIVVISGLILYKVCKDMDKKEKSNNTSSTVENMTSQEMGVERETYNDTVNSFESVDNNSLSGTDINDSNNQVQ